MININLKLSELSWNIYFDCYLYWMKNDPLNITDQNNLKI